MTSARKVENSLFRQQFRIQLVNVPLLDVVVRRFRFIDLHVAVVLVRRVVRLQHVQLVELGTLAVAPEMNEGVFEISDRFLWEEVCETYAEAATDTAESRLSKLLDDLRMPLQGFFASGESVLRDILRTLDSALILTNFPKTVQPATTQKLLSTRR